MGESVWRGVKLCVHVGQRARGAGTAGRGPGVCFLGSALVFYGFQSFSLSSNDYVIIALICIEFLLTSMVSLIWERLIACLPAGTSRMLVGDCIGCLWFQLIFIGFH